MELTIVHELIHLHFAPVLSEFRRSETNRRDEERLVNDLAGALLKLDSGNRDGGCSGMNWRDTEVRRAFLDGPRQP
jgi:hypothetical protein